MSTTYVRARRFIPKRKRYAPKGMRGFMRIGVNAFPLRAEGGGSRYVFTGLLSALFKFDSDDHYIIFAHLQGLRLVYEALKSHGDTLGGTGPDPRVKVVRISDEGQIYGHRFDFDLLFGPLNNLQPRLYDRPTVAILHDIQDQYFPEYFDAGERIGRNEDYRDICRAATTVVTVSEFCKQTFVEKFGADPAHIEVVPNAPQHELVESHGEERWTGEPLAAGYLLYPANCYLHKNHATLLDAIEKLNADGLVLPVVFSGFEMRGGYPLRAEISRRKLTGQCRVFTDLPPFELRYLYRHARAVVMPTKFEGFGMPAIEAAACGVPVVCSDIPALREILGDSALYFDPDRVDDVAVKIRRIVEDASLRERLIKDGQRVAARFTWENSARRMLEIFRETRERFIWAGHKPNAIKRPRIGILIRLIHGGTQITRTVESLLCTGYPELIIRCEPDAPLDAATTQFLISAGVEVVETNATRISDIAADAGDGYGALETFANDRWLDIVGEISEGNRVKMSGLDSAAWGYFECPDKAVQLAEAMEWTGDAFVGIARLRLTGSGFWKMEGRLYPEMLFINCTAMRAWAQGRDTAMQAQAGWRWSLIHKARLDGKLFHSPRTLVDADRRSADPFTHGGAAPFTADIAQQSHYVSTRRSRAFNRVAPAVKVLARALPLKWQHAGTRTWYRFAR